MLFIYTTLQVATACEAPPVFETDPSLVDVAIPDPLGTVEVTYGRGPRPDDASCAENHSWMEIAVDVPADVGVRVEVEASQGPNAPELGALQGGVYAADSPIVLFWPETEAEAERVLHYTLWLTPVNAAGVDGPFAEWEGYSETRSEDVAPTSLCSTAGTSSWTWWPVRR